MMNLTYPSLKKWKISRLIGAGTTAQVYEATRNSDGVQVALKVVELNRLADEDMKTRVIREASTLQHLRHPGIVRLHGAHQEDSCFILELEYVVGQTLREWMIENKSPLLEPRLWILAKIAEALSVAHGEGVIHRDLKPENILVSDQGEIKLTDFGLAKKTSVTPNETLPGSLLGSLAYMAPEILSGIRASKSSDVFSFGVIAFELCTDRHPFPHEDAQALFLAWNSTEKQAALKLDHIHSGYLEQSLLMCLNRIPEERPNSLWEVYAALMGAVHESGVSLHCQALVARNPESPSIWMRVLAEKQAVLNEKIRSSLSAENLDRKKSLALISEFSNLFPHSNVTGEYLSSLAAIRDSGSLTRDIHKPRSRRSSAVILFLILAAGSAIGWRTFREKSPVTAVTITPPETRIEPTPLVSENQIPLVGKKRGPEDPVRTAGIKKSSSANINTPAVSTGTLNLVTDPEVRVFVDGRRFGARELEKLALNEGSHQVLLERDGFLPIEQKITIKKGLVTRIYARDQN